MKLFEHEGKDLFAGVEIPVLKRAVVKSVSELDELKIPYPVVGKTQVLSGKRGKRGLVKVFDDSDSLKSWMNDLLGKVVDGEVCDTFLIEEAVVIAQELFVSITYSTKTRGPVLLFSSSGGVEVEDVVVEEEALQVGNDIPDVRFNIDDNKFADLDDSHKVRLEAKIWSVVQKLWGLFQDRDLFLAEINPLVITTAGEVFALDAKVVTDDAAGFRQNWDLPERNMMGTQKSWAEIESEKIDAEDHRGAVGRVYLDLLGDIGVIAAGGGASLVAMDAMVGYNLRPANYTEFSGNPPGYKVKRLTEIVLKKAKLKGAILVGGKANFTDQVETLSGFLEALEEINPNYPIVVRRDGPGMEQAKKMLENAAEKHGWDMVVYDSQTSIIDSVKKLVEMIGGKSPK